MPAEQCTRIFPVPSFDATTSMSHAASVIFEMEDETESLTVNFRRGIGTDAQHVGYGICGKKWFR